MPTAARFARITSPGLANEVGCGNVTEKRVPSACTGKPAWSSSSFAFAGSSG